MLKRMMFSLLITLLSMGLFFCSKQQEQTENTKDAMEPAGTVVLWNGQDFNGWTFCLEDSAVSPSDVWSVREGNLSCTGVPSGYIRTVDEFSDYLLTLEWRWMEEPGNSGVLLHVQDSDMVWPVCIEAQLKSGDAGDIYLIGGTEINEHLDKESRRIGKKQDSSEKEPGEWNNYEITCKADSMRLVVNGVLQNAASGASVTKGRIALQSEGKPIEFRNITLKSLK